MAIAEEDEREVDQNKIWVFKEDIDEIENFSVQNKELLNQFSLEQGDLEFVIKTLRYYQNFTQDNLLEEIDKNKIKYEWIWNIIAWFIKLFEQLENTNLDNQFRKWISNNFPFFWKQVLANILWKIEIDKTVRKTKEEILETIEARESSLGWWAMLYETWNSDSKTVLIDLSVLLSEWIWSLADWAYIWKNRKKWFTSYGWWRSSYSRALLKNIWWEQASRDKIWYLDYPKEWEFNVDAILDSLVSKIKEWNLQSINIHGASLWGKLALELVHRLAEAWIRVNKLFINWWALVPENVVIPWFNLWFISPEFKWKLIRLIWKLSHLKKKYWKNFDWNELDERMWDRVNEWVWVNSEQLWNRILYLLKKIDFVSQCDEVANNVWEVIAIKSVPKVGATNDWMVSNEFADLLIHIFWEDKVNVLEVTVWHYMVPNNPSIYAEGINELTK